MLINLLDEIESALVLAGNGVMVGNEDSDFIVFHEDEVYTVSVRRAEDDCAA